jgi:malonyl-CoA/methylmalonyl-CoA synthetase
MNWDDRWPATARGDRDAICAPEGSVSRDELELRVLRAAGWLSSRGVGPRDVVALAMPKELAFVELVLGAMRLGAVALPLNERYTPRELRHPLQHAPARLAVLPPSPLAALADTGVPLVSADTIRAELDAASPASPAPGSSEDVALLMYTSGTTGQPKGVPLTKAQVKATVDALHLAWGWREDDVLLNALPQYHIHGLVVATFGALAAGACSVWLEAFEPRAVLDALASGRATVFMGVPTFWHRMLDQPGVWDLSRLRLATSGSAGLPAAVHRAATERFGVDIVERYGMTEAGIVVSNPLGAPRPGSVGLPLPGVEVAVCGPDGAALPDGEVGELYLRAPSVFSGYHRDPQATAGALSGGWLKSGDLGYRAEDGYLCLVGRRSELVIVGGLNVYPAEVEQVLLACPGVREAAVVGLPDEDLGEVPVAALVGAVDLDEVRARLRAELAPYKIPRILRIVEALPRNAMGKIVKSVVWSTPPAEGEREGPVGR